MENIQNKKEGVTIVRDASSARHVISVLKSYPDRVHAWDTETIDIDVKQVSPVGNGKILSA
jgi:DNA polymerase I